MKAILQEGGRLIVGFKICFCLQVVFLAALAIAAAAPQQGPSTEPIPILRQEQEVNFDGTYKWRYVYGSC